HCQRERRDPCDQRRRTLAEMLETMAAAGPLLRGERAEGGERRDQRRRTHTVDGDLLAPCRDGRDAACERRRPWPEAGAALLDHELDRPREEPAGRSPSCSTGPAHREHAQW